MANGTEMIVVLKEQKGVKDASQKITMEWHKNHMGTPSPRRLWDSGALANTNTFTPVSHFRPFHGIAHH
jgi:hypothetical protein